MYPQLLLLVKYRGKVKTYLLHDFDEIIIKKYFNLQYRRKQTLLRGKKRKVTNSNILKRMTVLSGDKPFLFIFNR